MEKIIKLLQNSAVYNDRKEFVITDCETLILKLEREYQKSSAYINCEIENEKKCQLMKDDKIELDAKFLRNGFLKCSIELRENGVTIKKYSLEPLKITKLDGEYRAIPEVESLREETKRLKEEVETYAKLVKNLYGIKIGG